MTAGRAIRAWRKRARWDLPVPVTLAAVAGFVDAVGFSRFFGVFPANQSGNVIFLGMALGGSPGVPSAWRSGLAIVSFAVGTAMGLVIARRVADRRRHVVLLTVEFALLSALAIVAGPITSDLIVDGALSAVLLVLAGVAMGVQTDVISRLAGVGMSTTYQTGALTHIAQAVVGLVDRGFADAPRRTNRVSLGVLSVVFGAYLLGAVVGAGPGRSAWALYAPPIVVLALGVASWRWPGAESADDTAA